MGMSTGKGFGWTVGRSLGEHNREGVKTEQNRIAEGEQGRLDCIAARARVVWRGIG